SGADTRGRPWAQHSDVSRAASVHACPATAAGGSPTAAARRLGHDLRDDPCPACPGDPGHDDCPAAWYQPPHGLCVSAADQAPESPQPPAVRPGLAALHVVCDPALAGGVHGQHATLAGTTGLGL